MNPSLSRRLLLGGGAGLGLAAALPYDIALAQAAPGGTLRVGMTAAAIPLSNGVPDQGAEGHRFMGITLYDQLAMWDLSSFDKPPVIRPGLATEWRVDPADTKRWIITLREGVKFHDGKVLTAEDVAFSFDRAFRSDAPHFDNRAAAQARIRMPTIASWRAEGEKTFIVETRTPDSLVPFGLTWIGITHRGAWEAAGRSWDTFLNRAVGTGPYRLESFSIRERAVLLRNPDYWDAARIPRHERVILLPLPEANTRVAALRSNQVDFIEAPPPDAVPSLRQAGFQIVTNTYPHTWTWHFSMIEGSPWRDIRVRRAANLAVDRSGMKTMLGGLMVEGAGLLPPGHPWHGRPSDPVRTDVAAARRLMAEAGFSARNPLRTKVAISPSGSGQMQPLPMNEAVQQNLKEIGIEIDFEVVEWNALLGLWREGARALAPRGITAINVSYSVHDPFAALVRFLKTEMAPPASNNWGFFSDPAYDAIMDRVYTTFDPAAQDALLAELHAKAVDDRLFLFVAHDLNPRAMSRRVQGFVQAQSWFQDLTPITIRG
ncbi:ABC transporter substrate-binding protein [Roseomonas alkaliterrae]|uniref:ABC-type transport system substrate-binding protein n=1 Tax=Neoroseomonas alkaliterrae TaxID=1452450 RepID=A0A840XTX6_9PROT|nr:ABC transporter substrate-binding protein [Neoroseomonas alkaliterrae]MBB5691336.1 ABC-type transport system substrate-binding protein [Neoroseomonas alkaliterrae]MBR0677116.1 ABC transporter substrate-binding protein [Neoroseomonas alkaliterrae]